MSDYSPNAPPPSEDPPALPMAFFGALPNEPLQSFSDLTPKEKRDKVAFEILDTERTYVQSLGQLVGFYLKGVQTESIISKQQVKEIFGNVDNILIINQELLEGLEKRMKIWDQNDTLGDVLNKLIPWLRLYSEYCANYQNSNTILSKAVEKTSVSDWFNDIKDKNNILDIFSLLIMPIQRIPRYKLLLEQLLKYTPDFHPDFAAVTNALEKVQVVANLINEGVRKREQKEQLEELSKRLTGKVPKNLVTAHRFLVHEGELTKLCRKVPKKRNFFLFNDLLLYGEATNIHLTIYLNNAKINPVEDSEKAKNAFKLMSKEKSFVFWADTPEEKVLWASKFQAAEKSRAQMMNRTLGPEEGKQGEEHDAFAALWQNDGESNVCPLCRIKFTTIRRKHHCRKCGTLVCAKCSEHKFELPTIGKGRVCDDCFFELSGKSTERKVLRDKIASNRTTLAGAAELQKQLEEAADDIDADKPADVRKLDKKQKKKKKQRTNSQGSPGTTPRTASDPAISSPNSVVPESKPEAAAESAANGGRESGDSPKSNRPTTINFDSFRGKPLPPPPGGSMVGQSPLSATHVNRPPPRINGGSQSMIHKKPANPPMAWPETETTPPPNPKKVQARMAIPSRPPPPRPLDDPSAPLHSSSPPALPKNTEATSPTTPAPNSSPADLRSKSSIPPLPKKPLPVPPPAGSSDTGEAPLIPVPPKPKRPPTNPPPSQRNPPALKV